MSLLSFLRRIKDKYHLFLDENYNIGFIDNFTPEQLIEKAGLNRISWLKHPYRDRFFADPFILSVTDSTIDVLVEELRFDEHKGFISHLVVDRKTKKLLSRNELLNIDTHLSYPAIIKLGNDVFVYPENCEGGALNVYQYERTHPERLVYKKTLIHEPVVDSTIIEINNSYYLLATRSPDTQSDLHLYKSDNYIGEYSYLGRVVEGYRARPAGNLFCVNKRLFRPSQNCERTYGASIDIMEVDLSESKYSEKCLFSILPSSFKYNLGIHTINFSEELCVVDGYGYLYPIWGRLRKMVIKIINVLNK